MYNVRENEHQEVFHLGIDPRRPFELHIPSPLGKLGYFLYVRLPQDAVPKLERVGAEFDLVGLHSTKGSMAAGEGVPQRRQVESKQQGLAWYCLAQAQMARGTGPLTLTNWPEDLPKTDFLATTWPRFVESGMADDWIRLQADPQFAPTGVPLGGIGGGRVDICKDGRFRNFSLNNNQDAPMEDPEGLPGAYLAIEEDGTIIELASRPIVPGHRVCKELRFRPRFPQAMLDAPGVAKDLDATVMLAGTLVPHDLKRSSVPGVLVRWELHNRGAADRKVRCRMSWPNLIGIGGGVAKVESKIGYGDGYYHHWDDPTGRAQRPIDAAHYAAVRYTGEPAAEFKGSRGEHLLAVNRHPGVDATARAVEGGGEVIAEVLIPAGKSATATMALLAVMPHWIDSLGVDRGMHWQNHYAGAEQMLTFLLDESDHYFKEGAALAALLDDSSLPDWLKRRLSNCIYPLVTNSVLYKDGRFSINEGPTEMGGCYGTIDQRLAAHPATQLFFPQLNARELMQFAAIQSPEGGIQHDLGSGHLERGPGESAWPDLTCSFVIQTARHAWSTGDADFDQRLFEQARKAIQRHAKWAEDGGGVAQTGKPPHRLGTSYDSYHYIGTTAYIGTLWLAALAVIEAWGRRRSDDSMHADIARWRKAAIERLEQDLWNGRFYVAYNSPDGPNRETSHAGQLAGEVFTRLLLGQDVLDEKRVKAVVDALLMINGNEKFAIPPDEANADLSAGADFGWLPYVEGFMLSAAAAVGDERLWKAWERVIRAMDDHDRHPCDTRLMYRPHDGSLSWGTYYMTAPASWLVYDAWLNFFYDAGAGMLRLRTDRPGKFPLVHPLFWATVEIGAGGKAKLIIHRTFADKPLPLRRIEPAGLKREDKLTMGTTIVW